MKKGFQAPCATCTKDCPVKKLAQLSGFCVISTFKIETGENIPFGQLHIAPEFKEVVNPEAREQQVTITDSTLFLATQKILNVNLN